MLLLLPGTVGDGIDADVDVHEEESDVEAWCGGIVGGVFSSHAEPEGDTPFILGR